MLNYMRNNVKTFGVKFILLLVIGAFVGTIFLVWGMGGGREEINMAVTVNGQPISIAQFYKSLESKRQFYRNIYKERFNSDLEKQLNLKQKTMDDMIVRYLLLDHAEKQNITVSDEEVKARIKSYPSFQENGVFSTRAYKQLLGWNRMTPAQFEQEQRNDMIIEKVSNLVKDQVKVSKSEILEEYQQRNAKIKVKYLLFEPEIFMDQVTVSDKELKNYFANHQADYRQPERRRVNYLTLNAANLEPGGISEDRVRAYYDNNKKKYHKEQQVKASHILLKTSPGASETAKAEVKAKAEKLLERIKKGETFAGLAKEFSEDTGSATNGGDLGFFGKGRMVPAFEQAAFSLAKGQVSGLVETPYGYHIIKVTDIMPEKTLSLQEVYAEIQNILKRDESMSVAEDLAEDAYLDLTENKITWDELAQRPEWEAKETDFFNMNEAVSGIFPDSDFKAETFKLVQEEVSPPVKINNGFVLLKLADRQEAYLPELTEVKDKVTESFKQEKAALMAKEKAEKAIQAFKQGIPFDQLTKEVEVKESELFSRLGFIPEIGPARKFAAELFELEKGQISPVLLVERGNTKSQAVFLLEDKQDADESKLKDEEDQLRSQILAAKQEKSLQTWVNSLKEQAEIEINEKLLD